MTRKPRLLDLFCCAGGAAMGYSRAGFEVVGVDHVKQPHYPFEFHQADALTFPLDGFDAIHASPPCQAHSSLRALQKGKVYPDLIPQTRERLKASGLPYVIENVAGAPLGGDFLIMLCGTMFGLQTPDGRAEIRRHRLFEMSFSIALRPACQHGGSSLSVAGHAYEVAIDRQRARATLCVTGNSPEDRSGPRLPNGRRLSRSTHGARYTKSRRAISVTGNTPQTNTVRNTVRETFSVDDARAAMGISWMPMKSLSQAIPPAYTEFIGMHLVLSLGPAACA